MSKCPNYLKEYAELWARDPHAANLAWFRNAEFGLFMHYGLYSQLERHEWVMEREKVPVAEYAKLFDTFDPSAFDADAITDLALEAGMRYVNITACHHEGFCLWDSKVEPFNSKRACGRDLLRELGEACDRKGLGFFCYFTHMTNWRHPYALTRDLVGAGRPNYPDGDPVYRLTKPEEWTEYWKWSHGCIRELCELDYPVAGIWLDLIRFYYLQPELTPIEDTYALIRQTRPETLISFKQGATGDEDFASPEFHFRSQGAGLRKEGREKSAAIADAAWEKNKVKHNEICMTLQEGGWGYNKGVPHKDADTIWGNLAYARANNCNLLANTGPLPDGSLHGDDVATLREVGRRIRELGYPKADSELEPKR